jgi:hypothetical protein
MKGTLWGKKRLRGDLAALYSTYKKQLLTRSREVREEKQVVK